MPTTIGIVGLGLIGGSLALALKASIVGYDADPPTRAAARQAGLQVAETLEEIAHQEIVVLAVPLPAIGDLLPAFIDCDITITDTTSVKAEVLELMRRAGLADRYVGGHPMAGTANSGFTAADPALFTDARWPLTIEPDTDMSRWMAVAKLVTKAGAVVVPTTSAEHDDAVAWISHVPHVVAEAIAAGADSPLKLALAAGSFRDMTRVAGTRPALVEAMLDGNADAVRRGLDTLIDTLTQARDGGMSSLVATGYGVRRRWESPQPLVELHGQLLEVGRAGGFLQIADDGTVTALGSTDAKSTGDGKLNDGIQ